MAANKRFWKLTPKFRIFIHLVELQSNIANPNTFWAYADEDLQRHIGEIASSCSTMNLAPMVLYKWGRLVFDDDSSRGIEEASSFESLCMFAF